VLRTRSPLSPGQALVLARLACVRRAASVRPEPGSNSPSRSRPAHVPRWRVVPVFDRRAAHRSHSDRGATVCPPARRSCEHGIDMSQGCRSRSNNHWRHWLLAFTALFSRSGSPTGAPWTKVDERAGCRSDTHSFRGRERPEDSSVGVNRLHRSGPRSSGKPACGATDETTGEWCACQTGATPAAPQDPRRTSRSGCAGAPYTRRVIRRALAPISASRSAEHGFRRAPHRRR
jgi:hypothetical protein